MGAGSPMVALTADLGLAQGCLNQLDKGSKRKRLDHIATAASVEVVDPGSVASNKDNRQSARLHFVGEGQSVDAARYQHINDYDVNCGIVDKGLPHVGPIADNDEVIAFAGEKLLEQVLDVALVLDEQNLANL